jgi:hypothetical protein
MTEVRKQMTEVRKQMTEDRKQRTEDRKQRTDDKQALHPPVLIICLLSSDLCPLKTDL